MLTLFLELNNPDYPIYYDMIKKIIYKFPKLINKEVFDKILLEAVHLVKYNLRDVGYYNIFVEYGFFIFNKFITYNELLKDQTIDYNIHNFMNVPFQIERFVCLGCFFFFFCCILFIFFAIFFLKVT
jgi:hypothetical protein